MATTRSPGTRRYEHCVKGRGAEGQRRTILVPVIDCRLGDRTGLGDLARLQIQNAQPEAAQRRWHTPCGVCSF
eukprot:COSAG02_NODE_1506_length_12232_cov_420.616088_3_plen_73_part_00